MHLDRFRQNEDRNRPMITVTTDDAATYSALTLEYDASLPLELRHKEPLFVPDVAFVAWDEGVAWGCVGLSIVDDAAVIMRHLYVRPEHRKRGVARTLLDALIGSARARGARKILLDTDRTRLAPAYQLYRSLGFVECAPYGQVDYDTPTFLELALE